MEIQHLEREEDFALLIERNIYAVVDFYSEDCPPCEKLAPVFERLSQQYAMVTFVKIFRQQFRPLAVSLGVSGSPTLLFFYRGQLQDQRLAGEIQEEAFKARLDALLLKEQIVQRAPEKRNFVAEHDVCVIGTGPAGCTASIYAARYHVDHILVGELAGGLMTSSHKICNYPSENEISGMDLTQKMIDHVQHLNVPIKTESVSVIEKTERGFDVVLSSGGVIRAKMVLLANGTRHKHLGIENEEKFAGRGISYCATCDAAFFKDKIVAVVGGSDSANTAALYLAEIARHVYQIYRGDALRGETAWIEQIKKRSNITVLTKTNVVAVSGESILQGIELDQPFDGRTELSIDGLFIEIGSDPDGKLIQQLELDTDRGGYIVTQADQRTSVEGVWAAGDVTTNSDGFRQIVTACSEGAIAARSIFYALKKQKAE